MTQAIHTQERPNVLVMFCDQLRLDLLGCYGGSLVRTPHIDALAADSTLFDRAYTPTALCSPARASLLSGLYALSHHMFNNSTPPYSYCEHLRPGVTLIQDWVDAQTDYESAYFGKWHVGTAEDLFRSRFHHTQKPYPGCPPFLHNSHWHPDTRIAPLVQSVAGGQAGTLDVPMDGFPDVVAANYSQEFLRQRSPERPFLLFCAFPGPHSPWMVPEEFGIRYDPAEIPMWANRYDRFGGKPLGQKKLRLLQEIRSGAGAEMDADDAQLRELLACCFSYLELVDQQVGRMVATLKELNLYEQTAVIFTADHGDMAGAHGFLSKGSYMYDEIYRIPMLFKPAGPPQPQRSQAPVHLMDVTATCVHLLAGQELTQMGEQPLHGQSLARLVTDPASWVRQVHYAEYHGDWYGHYSARMVTDGRWKLVWNLFDLCELYDLIQDPHEMTNLFYEPAHTAVRAHYFRLMVDEARRLGDGHLNLLSPEVEAQLPRSIDVALELS